MSDEEIVRNFNVGYATIKRRYLTIKRSAKTIYTALHEREESSKSVEFGIKIDPPRWDVKTSMTAV